jgi:sugar phosphate isomerase/epimerase
MSNRRIGRTGPAIAAALLLVLALPSLADSSKTKRDDSASEKIGIKLSLQCWTFNKLTFFETVDKAAGLGVKYIEMFPGQLLKPGSKEKVDWHMFEETIAEIKKKLADAGGLKVIAFGVAAIPTEEKEARKMYEWAKKMGIEVLVTETTPTDVHEKLCEEFKIKFALHNHPKTWPPAKILDNCKSRSKLMGSCSDTGHWQTDELIPVEQLKKLEGRVLHSHFKDKNQLGRGHDVAWGTGKGDAKGMMAELKRQGFKGYLSIEYEFGDLAHLDANLPKCVEFFDKTAAELAKE